MIISVDHGATLLPANSPVIGSLRSAPQATDGVSGPPLFPDQGLPGLLGLKLLAAAAIMKPPVAPEPPAAVAGHKGGSQAAVKVHKGKLATVAVAVAPRDAGDPDVVDPGYDEAVEKLLWFLVVG